MAGSTLDPDNLPPERRRKARKGTDVDALGPSDRSDTHSDMAFGAGPHDEAEPDSTSDAEATGENATVGRDPAEDPDRGVDRIIGEDEAGLGRGPDEAEEARRKK